MLVRAGSRQRLETLEDANRLQWLCSDDAASVTIRNLLALDSGSVKTLRLQYDEKALLKRVPSFHRLKGVPRSPDRPLTQARCTGCVPIGTLTLQIDSTHMLFSVPGCVDWCRSPRQCPYCSAYLALRATCWESHHVSSFSSTAPTNVKHSC